MMYINVHKYVIISCVAHFITEAQEKSTFSSPDIFNKSIES